jgi:hypothetical protein
MIPDCQAPSVHGRCGVDFQAVFGIGAAVANGGGLKSARALGPFSDCSARLSDADIRGELRVLRDRIRAAENDIVLEEVECWRGYARADFLCVSGGALSVIEIKSDRDNLRRFDEQVRVYSGIADRVTLVVGWSLAAHALRAAPSWWDVVLAERDEMPRVRFVPLRDGAPNPGVSVQALVGMLPVGELRCLARACGLPARLCGSQLQQFIASRVSRRDVHSAIGAWLLKLSEQRASTS